MVTHYCFLLVALQIFKSWLPVRVAFLPTMWVLWIDSVSTFVGKHLVFYQASLLSLTNGPKPHHTHLKIKHLSETVLNLKTHLSSFNYRSKKTPEYVEQTSNPSIQKAEAYTYTIKFKMNLGYIARFSL